MKCSVCEINNILLFFLFFFLFFFYVCGFDSHFAHKTALLVAILIFVIQLFSNFWHSGTDQNRSYSSCLVQYVEQLSFCSFCVCRFFRICGMELTCLRMACCRFVNGLVVASVANHCPKLEGLSSYDSLSAALKH